MNMLDLAALEQALAPLEQVGMDEIAFEMDGHTIWIRPLLPREEIAAQAYAQRVIDEATDDQGNVNNYEALDYFDTFRVEALSYAICQINELDLRDEEWIATGQQTDTGKKVRVKKHVAMRDIIWKWSRPLLSAAFAKYGELLARQEQDQENLVEYEPADLDAEIDRVKIRLRRLTLEKERRAKGDVNIHAEQVMAIQGYEEAQEEATKDILRAGRSQESAEPEEEEAEEAEPSEPEKQLKSAIRIPPTVATRRRRVEHAPEPEEEWADYDEVPSAAQLQDDEPEPEPELEEESFTHGDFDEQPVSTTRSEPRQPVTPPRSPPPSGHPTAPLVHAAAPDPLSGVTDSFGDPTEDNVMAAETARILEARRRMAQERAREGAAQTRVPRVPPHMRGHTPSEGDLQPGGRPGVAFTADGRQMGEGARREVPVLSPRGASRPGQQQPVKVNQKSTGEKSRNKRFKPPGR
jgi:hypothetical protein